MLQVLEGVYNYIASIYVIAYLVYRKDTLIIEIYIQIDILLQSSLNLT